MFALAITVLNLFLNCACLSVTVWDFSIQKSINFVLKVLNCSPVMYKTLYLHEYYTNHILQINHALCTCNNTVDGTEIVYFRMIVRVWPLLAIIKRFIFVAISSILALTSSKFIIDTPGILFNSTFNLGQSSQIIHKPFRCHRACSHVMQFYFTGTGVRAAIVRSYHTQHTELIFAAVNDTSSITLARLTLKFTKSREKINIRTIFC